MPVSRTTVTRQQFLDRYNPDYQRKICASDNECFLGNYPTLSELRRFYGDNMPLMWLLPQLYNLSEYCGCKDKLQGRPLEECAFVIATEYYFLKVSELMLFFYRFKAGRYGRFYGSVDPMVITCSLRTFSQERDTYLEEVEREQERKRLDDMLHDPDNMTYEEFLEIKTIERMYEMRF